MEFKVLILSDWHIRDEKYQNVNLDALSNAIISALSPSVKNVLLFCGDIAQSGRSEEYKLAQLFFAKLVDEAQSSHKIIDLIFTPGNHDVYFESDDIAEMLSALVPTFVANPNNQAIRNQLLMPQENYRAFVKTAYQNGSVSCGDEFICVHKYLFDNHSSVSVFSLNSAFMSQKHEKYGEHKFPFKYYEDFVEQNKSSFNILFMHHPLNWFDYESRVMDHTCISSKQNLMILGHEHYNEDSIILKHKNCWMKAEKLDNTAENSSFIVLDYNEGIMNKSIFTYDCSESKYVEGLVEENILLVQGDDSDLVLKDEFKDFLSDVGMMLLHPRGKIELDDVFVEPKLLYSRQKNEICYEYTDLVKEIDRPAFKYCITGDERSGKTTLLKKLYFEFYKRNLIPVFVKGEELILSNKSAERNIKSVLDAIYETKLDYDKHKDRFVILIDNLDSLKSHNSSKYEDFIKDCFSTFNRIVITNNSSTLIISEELAEFEFGVYSIGLLRSSQRHDLIKNWIVFNNEIEENELLQEIEEADKAIKNIMSIGGFKMFPSYVLLFMSLYSGNTDLEASNENYFSFCHSKLVADSLSQHYSSKDQYNAVKNYLENLSNLYYESGGTGIKKSDFLIFHESYIERYMIEPIFRKMYDSKDFIETMELAGVLSERNNTIKFKYPYTYYYFFVEYIQHVRVVDQQKSIIEDICGKLYVDDCANIFIYLVHKIGPELLGYIYTIHDELEVNKELLMMDERIIKSSAPEIEMKQIQEVLDNPDAKGLSAEKRRKIAMDRDDESDSNVEDIDEDKSPGSSATPEEFNEVIIAIRLMEISSIILKHYWGQIEGEDKRHLVNMVLQNGLGIGKYFINTVSIVRTALIIRAAEFVRETQESESGTKHGNEIDTYVENINKLFANWVFVGVYATMKEISDKLKHPQFATIVSEAVTFEKLHYSSRVIELGLMVKPTKNSEIRNVEVLKKKIAEVFEEFEDFSFGRSLIKAFIADLFYNYDIDPSVRQSINAIVQVDDKKSLMISEKGKLARH